MVGARNKCVPLDMMIVCIFWEVQETFAFKTQHSTRSLAAKGADFFGSCFIFCTNDFSTSKTKILIGIISNGTYYSEP